MANDYYFFTDINQQASNATDYINVQTTSSLNSTETSVGAYGPILPGTPGTDEYRVTSLHKASYNPTAYAACDGIVCVQRIPVTITGTSPPLVNVILKPLVQPALNFAPIKYIIYKGILADSLIDQIDQTVVAASTFNDLTEFVWIEQAKKNKSAKTTEKPPAEALGVGLIAATPPIPNDLIKDPFHDDQPIDNLFYRTGVSFQLPKVNGGWSIGQFDKTSFGIEVLMEGLAYHHPLSLARKLVNKISVATLTGGETPAQVFDHWHAKEQVLGFMDPCAFYGSFFRAGIQAKPSGKVSFVNKPNKQLYHDVLFAFANKDVAYLDIRNEHGFSFNYFKNYGDNIQLSFDPAHDNPAPLNYYASKWPLMTLTTSSFPTTNTNKPCNAFQIQLPVGDNPEPLVYVSQGYRDINRKRKEFPAELKSSEQFYDAFKASAGGFTVTKNKSGMTSMTFVVPNVTDQSATTPAACYIRLKYLKQQQAATAVSTMIQSANFLDNLIYPFDLRILQEGKIKSSVYDEEIYVNAQGVAGLNFDFIGKVGIARDDDNTSFYLIPTNIRTQTGQSSTLFAVSGETSEGPGNYANLIASKYEHQRVKVSELMIATESVPVADFVSDGGDAQASLAVPDFEKLFMMVVANATYDSWKAKIAATLDGRFRTYLGVKNLQTAPDNAGTIYTSFELTLRGFKLNATAGAYEVTEVNTVPANTTDNVKVHALNDLASSAQVSPATQKVTIVPELPQYVVVLDKNGFPLPKYPILKFDIKGPPDYLYDVQVSRNAPELLTGIPGLANAWDKNQPPEVRTKQIVFSSWSNGEHGRVFNASGNATYLMPLDWWKDLARLPLKDFGTAEIRYRVVAWPSTSVTPTVWSTKDGAIAPKVLVRSNLLAFKLIDLGYIDTDDTLRVDDSTKVVKISFTVREANTIGMYTLVQWKRGSEVRWPEGKFAMVTDYGIKHLIYNPDWTIDQERTDPRYVDSVDTANGKGFHIPPDGKTATTNDSPGGSIASALGVTHSFFALDFYMRIHLNFEVPPAVTIVLKEDVVGHDDDGTPVYRLVQAEIAPPKPFIIDTKPWKARILQVRKADGTTHVTHPETYAGPQ